MNQVAYFEIQADEPHVLVEFYSKVFGWEFTKDESIPLEYWRIQTGGMNGGLLKRPAPVPQAPTGTNAFTCSIRVDDFDLSAMAIKECGGVVAMEKFLVPGTCWQGYFVDPEGNTFGLFQVDTVTR